MDDESAVSTYLRTRDPALFRLLVQRYHDKVFRLVVSLLGAHADLDAQEVTQEIFLRAHAKLRTFRAESRFGTWLYRLAYNRALEQRRRARLRFTHVSEHALHKLSADPFGEDRQLEREQLVAQLLEQLPDVYRAVINMHYWLGHSVDEIAAVLAVQPGTVKSYLSRARQRLRELAGKSGIDLPE